MFRFSSFLMVLAFVQLGFAWNVEYYSSSSAGFSYYEGDIFQTLVTQSFENSCPFVSGAVMWQPVSTGSFSAPYAVRSTALMTVPSGFSNGFVILARTSGAHRVFVNDELVIDEWVNPSTAGLSAYHSNAATGLRSLSSVLQHASGDQVLVRFEVMAAVMEGSVSAHPYPQVGLWWQAASSDFSVYSNDDLLCPANVDPTDPSAVGLAARDIGRSVVYGTRRFAVLADRRSNTDSSPVYAPGFCADNDCNPSCDDSAMELPSGWRVADGNDAYTRAAASGFGFGTECLVVDGGASLMSSSAISASVDNVRVVPHLTDCAGSECPWSVTYDGSDYDSDNDITTFTYILVVRPGSVASAVVIGCADDGSSPTPQYMTRTAVDPLTGQGGHMYENFASGTHAVKLSMPGRVAVDAVNVAIRDSSRVRSAVLTGPKCSLPAVKATPSARNSRTCSNGATLLGEASVSTCANSLSRVLIVQDGPANPLVGTTVATPDASVASSIENVISFQGIDLAVIDGGVSSSDDVGCQRVPMRVPSGWTLAPNTPLVRAALMGAGDRFNTLGLVLADGSSYSPADGAIDGQGMLVVFSDPTDILGENALYAPVGCSDRPRRVLIIRRSLPGSTSTTVDYEPYDGLSAVYGGMEVAAIDRTAPSEASGGCQTGSARLPIGWTVMTEDDLRVASEASEVKHSFGTNHLVGVSSCTSWTSGVAEDCAIAAAEEDVNDGPFTLTHSANPHFIGDPEDPTQAEHWRVRGSGYTLAPGDKWGIGAGQYLVTSGSSQAGALMDVEFAVPLPDNHESFTIVVHSRAGTNPPVSADGASWALTVRPVYVSDGYTYYNAPEQSFDYLATGAQEGDWIKGFVVVTSAARAASGAPANARLTGLSVELVFDGFGAGQSAEWAGDWLSELPSGGNGARKSLLLASYASGRYFAPLACSARVMITRAALPSAAHGGSTELSSCSTWGSGHYSLQDSSVAYFGGVGDFKLAASSSQVSSDDETLHTSDFTSGSAPGWSFSHGYTRFGACAAFVPSPYMPVLVLQGGNSCYAETTVNVGQTAPASLAVSLDMWSESSPFGQVEYTASGSDGIIVASGVIAVNPNAVGSPAAPPAGARLTFDIVTDVAVQTLTIKINMDSDSSAYMYVDNVSVQQNGGQSQNSWRIDTRTVYADGAVRTIAVGLEYDGEVVVVELDPANVIALPTVSVDGTPWQLTSGVAHNTVKGTVVSHLGGDSMLSGIASSDPVRFGVALPNKVYVDIFAASYGAPTMLVRVSLPTGNAVQGICGHTGVVTYGALASHRTNSNSIIGGTGASQYDESAAVVDSSNACETLPKSSALTRRMVTRHCSAVVDSALRSTCEADICLTRNVGIRDMSVAAAAGRRIRRASAAVFDAECPTATITQSVTAPDEQGGRTYALLDNANPLDSTSGCQARGMNVPQGWSIAEDDHVNRAFLSCRPWATDCVVFANGVGLNPGSLLPCGEGKLHMSTVGGCFRVSSCNSRVLIVKDNPLSAVNKAFTEVNSDGRIVGWTSINNAPYSVVADRAPKSISHAAAQFDVSVAGTYGMQQTHRFSDQPSVRQLAKFVIKGWARLTPSSTAASLGVDPTTEESPFFGLYVDALFTLPNGEERSAFGLASEYDANVEGWQYVEVEIAASVFQNLELPTTARLNTLYINNMVRRYTGSFQFAAVEFKAFAATKNLLRQASFDHDRTKDDFTWMELDSGFSESASDQTTVSTTSSTTPGAVVVTNVDASERSGVWQYLDVSQCSCGTCESWDGLYMAVDSKTEDVSSTPSHLSSIYTDIKYESGESGWGLNVPFPTSSPEWTLSDRVFPVAGPIKYLYFNILHREVQGTFTIDNPVVLPSCANSYRGGMSHGDPHYVSHDGARYDVQNRGEFLLMQDPYLTCQARHEAAGAASITSAIACKHHQSGSHFTIERPSASFASNSDIIVHIDGMRFVLGEDSSVKIGSVGTMTLTGRLAPTSEGVATLSIRLVTAGNGDGSSTITHRLRVSVLMSPSFGVSFLQVRFMLPAASDSRTSGLLGNNNGLKTDDACFYQPDGTVKCADVNAENDDIDNLEMFAEYWRVKTSKNSLFRYNGSGLESFNTGPARLSFSDAQVAAARAACLAKGNTRGGSMLKDCILDVAATGDQTLVSGFWVAARDDPEGIDSPAHELAPPNFEQQDGGYADTYTAYTDATDYTPLVWGGIAVALIMAVVVFMSLATQMGLVGILYKTGMLGRKKEQSEPKPAVSGPKLMQQKRKAEKRAEKHKAKQRPEAVFVRTDKKEENDADADADAAEAAPGTSRKESILSHIAIDLTNAVRQLSGLMRTTSQDGPEYERMLPAAPRSMSDYPSAARQESEDVEKPRSFRMASMPWSRKKHVE